jgi:hypothetical protein
MSMKRTFRWKTLLLALIFLTGTGMSAYAQQREEQVSVYFVPMHYVFDGRELAPPEGQRGFLYEGSAYVPLRFVAYALGKAVRWDQDTYTVTVEAPGAADRVEIDDYLVNRVVRNSGSPVPAGNPDPESIGVYFEKVAYVFDGVAKTPPEELPGLIYRDTLYVPMRFFSEAVGRTIAWDQDSYTVSAVSAGEGKADSGQDPADGLQGAPSGPSPADAPTPAAGGGGGSEGGAGGGTGGGGSPDKPSQASIEAKYRGQAEQLQNVCANELWTLATQYLGAKDAGVKADLKAQGMARMAECESEFNRIAGAAAAELSANGYSTDFVDQMRAEFQRQKELGETALCGSVGCVSERLSH